MPLNYSQHIPQLDGTRPATAQQHIDKMNDFADLEEVDDDDVQIRLFAQSLTCEAKIWYKGLAAGSISNLQQFHQVFLPRWEVKKNPLQILAEYEILRRAPRESVQDYSNRFNNLYNSIPIEIKPPPGLALLRYLDGFDTDMAYHLRERNPTTLEKMQKNVVSVEANLLAKKAKLRVEKRVTIKEEPFSSSNVTRHFG